MREAILEVGDRRWRVHLDDGTPISIRLDFDGDQPNAFHLPDATANAVEADGFVGDTERGGSVNCRTVTLNPHGNGTHTESIGHVVDRDVPVGARMRQSLIPSLLVSVETTPLSKTSECYDGRCDPDDEVVTRRLLEGAADRCDPPVDFLRALVLRTRPNDDAKLTRNYSGANPPYPTTDAIQWMRERRVQHLLVDLPSIDRESDGGSTPNHRRFWHLTPNVRDEPPRLECTVTEMIFVPDALEDGLYCLDLQIPDFALDAAPSRPILFEAEPVGRAVG
jgi:kynurenine formamidase